MNIAGKISYKCEHCQYDQIADQSFFEYEVSHVDPDRGMGPETCYSLKVEKDCDSCNGFNEIEVDVYEYPSNSLNHLEVHNCTGVAEINLDIFFEFFEEIYSYNNFSKNIKLEIHNLMEKLKNDPVLLRSISTNEFEDVVAEIFRHDGYNVEVTARSKDGGKDIIAISKGISPVKVFIECKRYAEDNKVGVELIRSLYGVKNERNGPNKIILVTTSSFTKGALDFAKNKTQSEYDIDLIDYVRLAKLIKAYPDQEYSHPYEDFFN